LIAVRQNEIPLKIQVQPLDGTGGIWFGDIDIDLVAFRVTCNGGEVRMAIRYYRLLCFLAQHPDKIVSRPEIIANTWPPEVDILPHTVDVHMNRLRNILRSAGSRVHIKTVRFQGYKLVCGPI